MPGLSSERPFLAIFTRERTFRFRPMPDIEAVIGQTR